MNCDRCGIEYRDEVPHPPAACATHASDELKKTKGALDGALAKIAELVREREAVFTPKEINMAIDSVGRNFKRLQDFQNTLQGKDKDRIRPQLEDLRLFHLKLLRWNRNTPKEMS